MATAFAVIAMAASAQAGVVSLSSASEFTSTHTQFDNFDTALNGFPSLYTFQSPETALYPSNQAQLPRSYQNFIGNRNADRFDPVVVNFNAYVYEVGIHFGNDGVTNFINQNTGAYITTLEGALRVFDADGNVLGEVDVRANNNDLIDQFIGVRSDAPIASAWFWLRDYTNNFHKIVALDDMSIGYELTPPNLVPLPPAAWMGLGLLGAVGALGRLRRRRS